MERSLNITQLSKSYGSLEVLRNISFTLKKGEALSVLGPSGCGKSTMLRLIAGLEKRYKGRIEVSGKVCMMFQEPRLLLWKTALENAAIGLILKGADRRKALNKARTLLAEVGLGKYAGYYPGQLSAGMSQRVALARTIALEPELVLLDEPFSSLDTRTKNEMVELFRKIKKKEDFSAISVTHRPGEAIRMASRLLVLSEKPCRIKKTVMSCDTDKQVLEKYLSK